MATTQCAITWWMPVLACFRTRSLGPLSIHEWWWMTHGLCWLVLGLVTRSLCLSMNGGG